MKRVAIFLVSLIAAACLMLQLASACSPTSAPDTVITLPVGFECEPDATLPCSSGCSGQDIYFVWDATKSSFKWEYQATGACCSTCTGGADASCGAGN
jgi:hypothetical protein